jgi:hypothetical protein
MTKVAVYSVMKDEERFAPRWVACTEGADYRLVVVDQASKDQTAGILHSAGVHVVNVDYGEMGGFRFDAARNFALDHLPDDVDLCMSLDGDEILDDGFLDALRAEHEHEPFDKGEPWIDTGTYWRCDRVHARHGYRWRWPCHEVTEWREGRPERRRLLEHVILHRPDTDPRTNYLPLLRLAVAEDPDDGRMWTYLARQLWYDGADVEETLAAVERALTLNHHRHEAAFLCRIGAAVSTTRWLLRGTDTDEPEAWAALANHEFSLTHWAQAAYAATRAHGPEPAAHYLTDQAARAYGSADLAARAFDKLGQFDLAVEWGWRAYLGNLDDGRLLTNLRWYLTHQAIPTYAIVAQKAGERDDLTAQLRTGLEAQGAIVYVNDSEDRLHRKWNNGLRWAKEQALRAGADRWNVIVINNDVITHDALVAHLSAALRSEPGVLVASVGSEWFAGWCHAHRGEAELRYDERFEWWYGDTDLARQVLERGGTIAHTPDPPPAHLYPNESTFSSVERLAAAMRDEARFAEKWNVDPATLFLATRPDLRALTTPPLTPLADFVPAHGVDDA